MRLKYSHTDIHNAYEHLVENAIRLVNKSDYEAALKQIKMAAMFQYGYNEIFRDDRLENLLKDISMHFFGVHNNTHQKDVVIFYSFITSDNRGLTQQYLSALSDKYKHIIYVTEDDSQSFEAKDTYLLLNRIGAIIYKLKTAENENLYLIKQMEAIINRHNPSHIFLHIAPWSIIPLVALWSYPNVHKFLINITDHAFGLGVTLIDKSIEFRQYGISVSMCQRKIEERRICYLPYYPWINETESFAGFPIDTTNKVVLFSGGDAYKISGDNDIFFHVVRRILDANSEVVFFFAGKGDFRKLEKLINLYNLNKRFVLIGNRHDIAQVFIHSDIYIGTFPTIGGLMTLYAAYYGKPIVALSTQRGKDVIVGKNEIGFAVDSVEQLLTEVNKLIRDKEYRHEKGNAMKKALITPQEFASYLYSICDERSSGLSYEKKCYNNVCVKNKYLELINLDRNGKAERFIVSSLKFKALFLTPKALVNRFLLFVHDILHV